MTREDFLNELNITPFEWYNQDIFSEDIWDNLNVEEKVDWLEHQIAMIEKSREYCVDECELYIDSLLLSSYKGILNDLSKSYLLQIKRKEKTIMSEVDLLFKPLIKAMDDFLDMEERDYGCLSNEEHNKFLKMRNYCAELYGRKATPKIEHSSKEKQSVIPLIFLADEDDSTNAIFRRKKNEMEMC